MILPPDIDFKPPKFPKGWKPARTDGYRVTSTGQVLRRDRIGKRRLTKAEKKAEKRARQAERRAAEHERNRVTTITVDDEFIEQRNAAINELNDALEKAYLGGPKFERDDIVTPEDVAS